MITPSILTFMITRSCVCNQGCWGSPAQSVFAGLLVLVLHLQEQVRLYALPKAGGTQFQLPNSLPRICPGRRTSRSCRSGQKRRQRPWARRWRPKRFWSESRSSEPSWEGAVSPRCQDGLLGLQGPLVSTDLPTRNGTCIFKCHYNVYSSPY